MSTSINRAPPRVLVVEDDPNVARMLRIVLAIAGFEFTQVTTGGEALQILDRDPPDAVVLDPGLPDGLGGAVLARLRSLAESNRVRTGWVVISAHDRAEVVARYGPLSAPFLPKPFDPWELVKTLEKLTGQTPGR